MNVVRIFLIALLLSCGSKVLAQATMSTSGNWATASNWSGSNIGDLVTETVTISNNINPTVFSGSNFTVGNTTLSNNNTLNVNSGGILNIGNSTTARSLTTNNNANITVAGRLEIWGNLVVNNNIVWNITGTVIIHGNVQLSNNANLNVNGGTLQIGGNFNATNNTNISVPSGSITVGGSVNVGGGSNLNGCAGCFRVGGSCSGPPSFCSSNVLPVTIVNFKAEPAGFMVTLTWNTVTEINFEKFVIERSDSGSDFEAVGTVDGHGNSNTLIKYEFTDPAPSNGVYYYRLKSVDYDGSFTFSDVVRADVNAVESIAIFPNPVDEIINIKTNFNPGHGDVIKIYNNVGLLVTEKSVSGSDDLELVVSLPGGIYVIHYVRNHSTKILRFIKN